MIKKILKVVLIVFAVLVVLIALLIGYIVIKAKDAPPPAPVAEENYWETTKSDAPLEQKYIDKGSFEVSSFVTETGSKVSGSYRIWYPSELEHADKIYPLVIIANATALPAKQYQPFFEHMASWGFIVAGDDTNNTGKGDTVSKLLDFCLESNEDADSIFCGKIDTSNIGIAGYSQGGPGALNAVNNFENGKYYKAIFTGSTSNKGLAMLFRWDYDVSRLGIPYFLTGGTGETDASEKTGIAPLSFLLECYGDVQEGIPAVLGRCVGAEHEDMLRRSDGYLTAWMLYWLQGDEEAGGVFFGDKPEILSNTNWQDVYIK